MRSTHSTASSRVCTACTLVARSQNVGGLRDRYELLVDADAHACTYNAPMDATTDKYHTSMGCQTKHTLPDLTCLKSPYLNPRPH